MKITNGKVFINGSFVDGGIEFTDRFLSVGSEVTDGDLDAKGALIIPGLIDIHTHGGMGADASDGLSDGLVTLGKYYAKKGVTSWLCTTMTLQEKDLLPAVKAAAAYERPRNGARIAGIHLEGPFLSAAKVGAQNPENLSLPDLRMFRRLQKASGNQIRLITIAPELPGALTFIKKVSSECTVSIGHSSADYQQAMAGFRAGASHITHMFNGMPGLHHRNPGIIAAALDAGATAELIVDGIHIDPAMIRLSEKLFGERLCYISDSLRCAGMPDGEYELGGQPIEMKNHKATLKGSNTLAGSSIHLLDGVNRCISFGIPLERAILSATLAPAKAIRMEDTIGSIAPGKRADFFLATLTKQNTLKIKQVYIDGIAL